MHQQAPLVECGKSIDGAFKHSHALHDIVHVEIISNFALALGEYLSEFCRFASDDGHDAFENHYEAIA